MRELRVGVDDLVVHSLVIIDQVHLVDGYHHLLDLQQTLNGRMALGLDQPPLVRMAQWYGGVARGELGRSILLNPGVGQAVLERPPVTLVPPFLGLAVAGRIGVPAGLLAVGSARAGSGRCGWARARGGGGNRAGAGRKECRERGRRRR